VYSNSLGAEAMVLTDIIWSYLPQIDVFSIDTGRLYEETYELLEKTATPLPAHRPARLPGTPRALERLVAQQGVNGFYHSLEARLECCRVRQGGALQARHRGLLGLDHRRAPRAVTGPRPAARRWSGTRSTDCTRSVRSSTGRKPRYGSTSARAGCRTIAFTIASFPSIGCSPCTRAIQPGESRRGRPLGGGSKRSPANVACIRGAPPAAVPA